MTTTANSVSENHMLRISKDAALKDMVWIPLLILGSGLLCAANETIDAFFVAVMLLIMGWMLCSLLFKGRRQERRVFLLAYAACALVAGLAQQYSLATFDVLQSTVDAPTFYNELSASPPFTTYDDITAGFNSPLAVLIWQQLYALTWLFGFKFGPYTGVLFNSLVVGVTGAITVATARELFGDDTWRLNRLGTLFAWCGMFWLFGAVLIRDCFTMLLNTLVLWMLVRWLCKATFGRLLWVIIVTGVSAWAMWYLRQKAVVLLGLYGAMALGCWYLRQKMNLTRLFVTALIPIALLFSYVYLEQYINTSLDYATGMKEGYIDNSMKSSKSDSLAMRLIINQPMPIRLVLGTGSVMVFPIPLWGYVTKNALDYDLIRTCNGIYQVLIMPLLLTGMLLFYREVKVQTTKNMPTLFLASYALINMLAVVATTMETRHVAQYLPAFLIFAALPDTRAKSTGRTVQQIAYVWFTVVIGVHILWWLMRL